MRTSSNFAFPPFYFLVSLWYFPKLLFVPDIKSLNELSHCNLVWQSTSLYFFTLPFLLLKTPAISPTLPPHLAHGWLLRSEKCIVSHKKMCKREQKKKKSLACINNKGAYLWRRRRNIDNQRKVTLWRVMHVRKKDQ